MALESILWSSINYYYSVFGCQLDKNILKYKLGPDTVPVGPAGSLLKILCNFMAYVSETICFHI